MVDDPLTEDLVARIEGWLISQKKTHHYTFYHIELLCQEMCNQDFVQTKYRLCSRGGYCQGPHNTICITILESRYNMILRYPNVAIYCDIVHSSLKNVKGIMHLKIRVVCTSDDSDNSWDKQSKQCNSNYRCHFIVTKCKLQHICMNNTLSETHWKETHWKETHWSPGLELKCCKAALNYCSS